MCAGDGDESEAAAMKDFGSLGDASAIAFARYGRYISRQTLRRAVERGELLARAVRGANGKVCEWRVSWKDLDAWFRQWKGATRGPYSKKASQPRDW